MNIYFINLDASTERRTSIETNLGELAGSEHRVHRVPAYDSAFIEKRGIPGLLRPNEKACYLSHMKAIELSIDDPGPSLILEDDAIFGTNTASLLTRLSAELEEKDIVFTDLCVPTASWMMRLFQLRRSLKDQVSVYDTRQIDFAGATAYTLNARSKIKLLEILKSIESLDTAYDLVLKNLVLHGTLTSGFVFPFITSISPLSSCSQVQPASEKLNPLVWDAFRRLAFLDSATFFPSLQQEIEAIPFDSNDRDVLAFSSLWKALSSDAFKELLR
ncbi:glycosyltransferase family 25 protein [Caballeronia glebae]|uniref:glycosyltransferase family 25 protein n=1 Tax=Caballeronia glebae TaxID=1777143 RepID=UPI0038BD1AF0